jgi:hypothetical protein
MIRREEMETETEICEKWGKWDILKGLEEPDKTKVAVLLENQRIYNEMTPSCEMQAKWKRLSIPIVRRLFPALKKAGINFDVELELKSFPAQWNSGLKLGTLEPDGRYKSCNNLDNEAEQLIVVLEALYIRLGNYIKTRASYGETKPFILLGVGHNKETDELIIFCRHK